MRTHLSLNVTDVNASVEFYSRVFGLKPQKQTPNYAKFDLQNPSLNFSMQTGPGDRLSHVNHLGIEVDYPEEISLWQYRLEKAEVKTKPEMNTTCCYARQDKIWFKDPDGNSWEIFYVHEHLPISDKEITESKRKACCNPAGMS